MNILITGAVGFLGFHLSTNLIGKGHKIIGIDDLSSGSKQNLELLLNTKNFEFINHDVKMRKVLKSNWRDWRGGGQCLRGPYVPSVSERV